jgi:hypothetical protein
MYTTKTQKCNIIMLIINYFGYMFNNKTASADWELNSYKTNSTQIIYTI